MTKNEFIAREKEDITTLNNPIYEEILKLFGQYIPQNVQIDSKKNVEGMYKFMYDYASKNRGTEKVYCIDPGDTFKEIMFKYLEIAESPLIEKEFSLEDFFS